MDGNDVSADHVIAELIDMGFEFVESIGAIEAVGPCLSDAVEFILNGSCWNNQSQTSFPCSTSQSQSFGQNSASFRAPRKLKQSNITDQHSSFLRTERRNLQRPSDASFSASEQSNTRCPVGHRVSSVNMSNNLDPVSESSRQDARTCERPATSTPLVHENESFGLQNIAHLCSSHSQEAELDWEQKAGSILRKQFGFSSLKSFQKEALEAWVCHRDCLILAATGSGKSLCFQIPALLTGKVVVVISPLISLMHDQCLKLAKHGVSACFLGSGQPDSTVECKAMSGMYKIVYVCPETLLRLIEPLKKLAENHGIALFAIDEVHCVSKWGHDFRPDYRLSVLRDNFSACNIKSLKFDIPLMALTATATIPVREDVIKSLHMSKETRIVLTSFFRPNLRFSVKNSKTTSSWSYAKDFRELIEIYTTKRMINRQSDHISTGKDYDVQNSCESSNDSTSDEDDVSLSDNNNLEDDHADEINTDARSTNNDSSISSKRIQLTVEYLEDELDVHHDVDDLDVTCGEFPDKCPTGNSEPYGISELYDSPGCLEQGSTIIYVPTRKETLKIADFLSGYGIRAAAYHAKLPKTHLRRVHGEFHHNSLEVVVATIAFGMGIDKSDVRRIIHYGWPQSLEAYYQEAGRAGRDGKLSDCTLYANLSRRPSLLPSRRSVEQKKQANKMLYDCFRYGTSTATCRAKTLVKYFGEDFNIEKCNLCDICVAVPSQMQNLKEEALIFMRVVKELTGQRFSEAICSSGAMYGDSHRNVHRERPNFSSVVSRIREQFQKFSATDRLWWQGLTRILLDKGYIREGDDLTRVSIQHPELTEQGLKFLNSGSEEALYAYPEADMLLSVPTEKPYSSFSEWGRGWADPEIRRQRLLGKKDSSTRKRKRWSMHQSQDQTTVRGRLAAKLTGQKR